MAQSQTPIERIEDIRIVGNRRIQETTIRYYIQSKANDIYNPELVRRDYRSLLNTNFFQDATVRVRGGETGVVVVFEVRERPLVRNGDFRGGSCGNESAIGQCAGDRQQ